MTIIAYEKNKDIFAKKIIDSNISFDLECILSEDEEEIIDSIMPIGKHFDNVKQLLEYGKFVGAESICLCLLDYKCEYVRPFTLNHTTNTYDEHTSINLAFYIGACESNKINITQYGLTLEDIAIIFDRGFARQCGFDHYDLNLTMSMPSDPIAFMLLDDEYTHITDTLETAIYIVCGCNFTVFDHDGNKYDHLSILNVVDGIDRISNNKPSEWLEKFHNRKYDDIDDMLQLGIYGRIRYRLQLVKQN